MCFKSFFGKTSEPQYVEYFPMVGLRSRLESKEDRASQASTSKSDATQTAKYNSGPSSSPLPLSSKSLPDGPNSSSHLNSNQNGSNFSLVNYRTDFKQKYSVRSSKKIEDGEEFDVLLSGWTGSLSEGEEVVGKKILKSQYESLLKKYEGTSEKWIDPSFPKAGGSPGVQWLSLENLIQRGFIQAEPCFISNKISPDVIKQGKVGDCYMLSPLAALAENDSRVLRIFPSLQLNPNGIYMGRLVFKGVLQEVIVDDRFPICVNDKGQSSLQGCQPAYKKQIWPMILEKCWAKLWGSYEATDSGYNYEVLHSLTGAATKTYLFRNISDNQALFDKLWHSDRAGHLICASTPNFATKTTEGIASAHAYTILSIHKFQTAKLLMLRNPWGYGESLMKANDADTSFWQRLTQQERDEVRHRLDEDDGIFAMVWEDFVDKFAEVTICKVHDDANYLYLNLEGKEDFQFVDLQTEGGYHSIAVSQTDRKVQALASSYKQVTLLVAEITNSKLKYKYVKARTLGGSSDVYMELNLKAGRYRICILLTAGDCQNHQPITFSIYSPSKFGIKQNREVECHDFLDRSMLSFAREKGIKLSLNGEQKEDVWIVNQLIPGCILGLFAIHVGKDSVRTGYRIQAGNQQYKDEGLTISSSLKDTALIEIQVRANSQSLIIFHMGKMPVTEKGIPNLPNPPIQSIVE